MIIVHVRLDFGPREHFERTDPCFELRRGLVDVIGQPQGVWAKIGRDGGGPSLLGMQHVGSSLLLKVSDPLLSNTILKMGVYST